MSARRIGGDWVENTDPNTGRKYYANTVTKKTQWNYPEELSTPDPEAAAQWTSRVDPNSGKTYYFNKTTQQSTWTKPACLVAAEGNADSKGTESEEWKELVDERSGRTYYFNTVTQKSSWTKPQSLVEAEKSTLGAASSGAAAAPATTAEKKANAAAKKLGEVTAKTTAPKTKIAKKGWGAVKSVVKEDKFSRLKAFRDKAKKAKMGGADAAASSSATASSSVASGTSERKKVSAAAFGGTVAKAFDLKSLANVVVAAVESHRMEEFAEMRFNLNRKGMFNARTDVNKILSHKLALIKTPLLQMQPSLVADAVQMFKNVMSYMGDRDSGKEGGGHINKLLKTTLDNTEEIKDELYCQILKQCTNNPKAESTAKGWELVVILTGVFPPSKDLEPYLLSFIQEAMHDANENTQAMAEFAMKRLSKTIKQGKRNNMPCSMEIEASLIRKPSVIRVYFLDGTFRYIPVQSWITVGDLSKGLAGALGIQDDQSFALFKISSDEDEDLLMDDERIMDIVAEWQVDYDKIKAKKSKGEEIEIWRFVFKVKLFLPYPKSDIASRDLYYIQAVHDVIDRRYPCNEQDCLALAALQLQVENGDYKGDNTFVNGKLSNYMPEKFLTKARVAKIEEMVVKIWGQCAGKNASQAKDNYIDYLTASPQTEDVYGSQFFVVEPKKSQTLPQTVVLAINARGILIIDPASKGTIKRIPYNEIVTWGQNKKHLVFVVGNLIHQQKMYFQSAQGKEMNALVHLYVKRACKEKGVAK